MSMTLDQFNRRKTSLVKRLESGLAKQFNAESFYLSVRAIPACTRAMIMTGMK